MRWKLLIAAPLLAAVAGTGAVLAIAHFLPGSAGRIIEPGWMAVIALLLPLAANVYAGVFVYRHTARRRTLQAAAATLLAIALTLAALLTVPYFFAPKPSPPTDVPPVRNI